MDLQQTVHGMRALRSEKYPEGILIAHDLGAHVYCSIESNCPEAIKLRRIITEAGLSIEEIENALYGEGAEAIRPPIDLTFPPDFSAKMTVRIWDKNIEIDMLDFLSREIKIRIEDKLFDLEEQKSRIRSIGSDFYRAYVRAIEDAKRTVVLPQLKPRLSLLLAYNCHITADEDVYLISFQLDYHPRWIYSHGMRYKLSEAHQKKIRKRIFLVFPVDRDGNLLTPYLVNEDGSKFTHYHGMGGDCWGSVRDTGGRWTGNISDLYTRARRIEGALATINQDSLMTDRPSELLAMTTLRRGATLEGEEGTVGEAPEEVRREEIEMESEDEEEDFNAEFRVEFETGTTGGRRWGQR